MQIHIMFEFLYIQIQIIGLNLNSYFF